MPLDESHCAVTYKVLVLGDYSVGKTALLRSLTGEDFKQDLRPTVGNDFVKKIFEVDGALVQLAIWDSAGQERFRSITKQQYRGVKGLVLVYDMTDKKSFETVQFWLNSIQEEMTSPGGRGSYEPTPFVICANKCDLPPDQREISQAKGRRFSTREMAFGYYETSAVTGQNVFSAFQTLAYHITDICDPKIMKSYHPYLIRPLSEQNQLTVKEPKKKLFRLHGKKRCKKEKHKQDSKKQKGNDHVSKDADGNVSMDVSRLRVWFTKGNNSRVKNNSKQLSDIEERDNNNVRKKKDTNRWKCVFPWMSCVRQRNKVS